MDIAGNLMNADLHQILKTYWGYDQFRSLQEEIIRSVTNGHDTLALMPTGGGKSITYQVSGLALEGLCLVVTPLIALMKDQVEDLRGRGLAAEAVYTGMERDQIESALNKAIAGKISFLYISPERLASDLFRARLRQMNVVMIAVDEAHCISQWGYDFRPSYLKIAEIRAFFPSAPILALTATATSEVTEDIQRQLKFTGVNVLSKSFRRENISYVVRRANDKLGELASILQKMPGCAIVYVRTRNGAEELSKFLVSKGIKADFYHAGLSSLQRSGKQDGWKDNRIPVIVATNAFGMGIDKPDVRVVVHYDIPDSPEAYFQEAGRAGRDGQRAYAVLLCNGATVTALKKRIDKGYPEKKYIREVYEALGNYFQLEEGSGGGMAFEFDADTFTRNFRLERAEVFSALKVLQVAGYMECTTEVNSRSRLCFRVLRDRLYSIPFDNGLQERLVELVLRTYSGIFVQYAFISEEWLAEKLGVTRQEVYSSLIALARRKIVGYVPGNDRPYIVYFQPRLPSSYLMIGREAYEDRKQVFSGKINRMAGYIEQAEGCRQLFLMDYFGQKEKTPCGQCDLCLERKKYSGRAENRSVDERILEMLRDKDIDIKDFVRLFDDNREEAVGRLRRLLDEGRVMYKDATTLALKPGKV